MKEEEEQK